MKNVQRSTLNFQHSSNEPLRPLRLCASALNPLACAAVAEPDDKLLCRTALDVSAARDSIMYMPGGICEITPSQGGKAVRVQVLVDPQSAVALEAQRAALKGKGKAPYFDFNHEDGGASFWPESFF